MKWISAIIFLVTGALLINCNTNEKSENDFNLQEKIEKSLLIKDLNAFNSELAAKRDLPRLYDIKSNTLIQSNLSRVNWRAFWIADAGGALKGGRWGARFGSAFSPSGTIAGAVVGGLLCGAISSALEEWVENGVAMAEIIQDFDICDAEVVYDEFCQISPVELTTAKNEIEIASLAIDSVFQTVGIVSIANYYYSLVEDSPELSDEDRYAICIGMAVASYSAKYCKVR